MSQIIMITVKYVLIVHHFEIGGIEVFANISASPFNIAYMSKIDI